VILIGRVSLFIYGVFRLCEFSRQKLQQNSLTLLRFSPRTIPSDSFQKLFRRRVDFSRAPPYARFFISSAAALPERHFLKENFCPTHREPSTYPGPTALPVASSASLRRSPGSNELLRFLTVDVVRLVFSYTYKHLCAAKNLTVLFSIASASCSKKTPGVAYPRRISSQFPPGSLFSFFISVHPCLVPSSFLCETRVAQPILVACLSRQNFQEPSQ
jgi:hypothetical protein